MPNQSKCVDHDVLITNENYTEHELCKQIRL